MASSSGSSLFTDILSVILLFHQICAQLKLNIESVFFVINSDLVY